MQKRIVIELPWPPTVNHYWGLKTIKKNRKTIPVMYTGKKGKEYRKTVSLLVAAGRHNHNLTGNLSMTMYAFPPDERRRDLDNLCKCVWDSLEKAGVYENDNQIVKYLSFMGEKTKGGKLIVEIMTLPEKYAKRVYRSVHGI